MITDDSEGRRKNYQDSLSAYGDSPRALKWASYKAAAQRYRELVADLDIAGRTILDAGCGMGDLLPFLYARNKDFKYTGMDITPGFIEIAGKRYKGHDFVVGDPFTRDLSEKYDIVVSSGVLNANHDDWMNLRKAMISRLFSYSREVLAFNMAGGFQDPSQARNIGYADSREVLNFCTTLSKKIILRNQYHSKDFTIVMFR